MPFCQICGDGKRGANCLGEKPVMTMRKLLASAIDQRRELEGPLPGHQILKSTLLSLVHFVLF
jgi:hypothetical protein